jgi:phosphonate transport system substrate-binding protein
LSTIAGVAHVDRCSTGCFGTADCERGTLDERYCDVDGDLIADIPDRSRPIWLDPDTLIFAYTPVEDPGVYKEAWSDFLTHLDKVTGKKSVFFPVQSNAAQIEAMRSGRLHISPASTQVPTRSQSIAPVSAPSPSWLRKMAASAMRWKSSPIRVRASRRSRTSRVATLAFTSETSNSGFKAPSALLKAEYGMVAGTDFEPAFSGKHDNSILGVANKDYPLLPSPTR